MSSAICRLHRIVVTGLLAGIVVVGSAAAWILIDSRITSGRFTGNGTRTTQVLDHGFAWVNQQVDLRGGSILAFCAGLAALALILLYLEVRHAARTAPRLILSRSALGEVAINLDQVGVLAQRETEHITGVREVETVAHAHKAGIDVKQRVVVEPEMAFTPLAEQVQQRVKQSLEHHLGFPVAGVQVLMQHASLRKSVI